MPREIRVGDVDPLFQSDPLFHSDPLSQSDPSSRLGRRRSPAVVRLRLIRLYLFNLLLLPNLFLPDLLTLNPVAAAPISRSVDAVEDNFFPSSFDRAVLKQKDLRARELAKLFIESSGLPSDDYEKTVGRLIASLRAQKSTDTPTARAESLRRVVLAGESIRASQDLADLDNLLPQRILKQKSGYCIGLTLLLLDLCDRLGWEACAVSVPRHTFLRLRGDEPINLETTLGGELKENTWYRDRFSAGIQPAALRELKLREVAGHLLNNVAFTLLATGDIPRAKVLIERALRLDPQCVEALTNLGVCAARLEDYPEALRAFEKTLEFWVGDPVTRLNRVNALLPLGRRDEAVAELVLLLEAHPRLTTLSERAREIRDQFELSRDWRVRQRLSVALTAQEVTRRGALPGLNAVYFRGTDLSQPRLRRVDKNLEFQWGRGSPGEGVPRDRFSARWTGWLDVPEDDAYTFLVMCSDGVRIWIDGRLIVDSWRTTGDNFPKADVDLIAGKHEIRVEYYEAIDIAGMMVILLAAGQKDPLELPERLFHAGPEPDPAKPNRREPNQQQSNQENSNQQHSDQARSNQAAPDMTGKPNGKSGERCA